ncbi:MAG: anti-sigma factor [Candidatus Zixiibacteriota bacterium]|nr:MAG: anti-sigma factor [candidate division Zixibacteria bacterium]
MHVRSSRLITAGLFALIVALIWGCSQPEDVVAPISTTKIHLTPAQLPSAPPGYLYELWTLDTNGRAYSAGKFIWDNKKYKFYDTDSSEIDNIWSVKYDLLDPFYEYLAVSIETIPDDWPDSIGPVILTDTIVSPELRPIQLVFPVDFGISTAGFCVETPTDKNSDSLDGCGVWFAFYRYDSVSLYDTVSVRLRRGARNPRRLELDTTYWICNEWSGTVCIDSTDVTEEVSQDPGYPWEWTTLDTSNLAELAATLDTLAIRCTTTVVDSFYVPDTQLIDTFVHRIMDFEFVTLPVNVTSDTIETIFVDPCTGSEDTLFYEPFTDYIHSLIYGIDSTAYKLDRFLSNHEEVPDLDSLGLKWHYKGWIISPWLDVMAPGCAELERLTKPAWLPFQIQQLFGDPDEWKIISTGSFKGWEHADDGNPYSDNRRVPDFPGEDFILNLPCGADSFYFASQDFYRDSIGEIFVTVEPDNFNEATNFPMILFLTPWHVPSYGSVSDTTANSLQDFRLTNVSGRVEGNPFGFPGIRAEIVRE